MVIGQQNPTFNRYFLTKGQYGTSLEDLPCQTIPTSQKNKEWKKRCGDALERIGINQLYDNVKFRDFYRMYEGKMSYMELSEVAPHLKDLESHFRDTEIPTFLKHYDIVSTVVNAIVGWYSQYEDKWTVTSVDEIETNEYERNATEMLTSYIREKFDKELQIRLLNAGLDPYRQDFESPEEQQAYIQQIQQQKQAMTPPEIQQYLSTDWKTAGCLWGDATMKADFERFQMSEMDTQNLIDWLLTGRCFRNHHIGYDFYKPEVWSPRNTFFPKTVNIKNVEDGEFCGRVHFYSRSEFTNRYANFLTDKQIRKILGGAKESNSSGSKNKSSLHMWEDEYVPFEQYHDYALLNDYQNLTGNPVGETSFIDNDGREVRAPRFIPNYGSSYGRRSASFMREDISVSNNLIQTTEAYWVSWKKVLFITYQREDGLVVQDYVSDELASDFLEENNIKKLTRCLSDYEEAPEVNSYIVTYIPEIRYIVKGCTSFTDLEEDIYIGGDPIDYQIKGNSNIYDFKLPVSGMIGDSFVEKLYPFQCGYNLAMNQLYNLMEKEIGLFFLFDVNFIPSEYKNYGDTDTALNHMMNVAKSLGIYGMDTSKQNTNGTTAFQSFTAIDLSLTNQMQGRMVVAEHFYGKALQLCGITPQALGTPTKYETAEGIRQGMNSSMVQLQIYNDKFDLFKKRDWDIHLSVAQACQKDGKDITVMYCKSDLSKAYLNVTDPMLNLRQLNVMAVTNSKKRKELEGLKQILIQNNTMGGDILDLSRMYLSDSMNELIEATRSSREYQAKMQEVQHQRSAELQQQQQQFEVQKSVVDHQKELEVVDRKGAWSVREEEINAMGRAADKNADLAYVDIIKNQTQTALKQGEIESNERLKSQELEMKSESNSVSAQQKWQELALKGRELEERAAERKSREYTSGINKN